MFINASKPRIYSENRSNISWFYTCDSSLSILEVPRFYYTEYNNSFLIISCFCSEALLLTSVPACRKSLRAEKYGIYFDFEHAKKSTHIDIFQNLMSTVFYSHF